MADETLIFVRTHSDSSWALWKPHLSEVVEIMAGRRKEAAVCGPAYEILEVRVVTRIMVGARVQIDDVTAQFDGSSDG